MYWFGDPPYDMTIAPSVGNLFRNMSRFFRDSDSTYRIFLRRNPLRGIGGVALERSFLHDYNDIGPFPSDDLFHLLAHELVHTWPHMGPSRPEEDVESPDRAWYTEGIAEYYALMLPYRFVILEGEKLRRGMNDLATQYYTNPLRNLSNVEAN